MIKKTLKFIAICLAEWSIILSAMCVYTYFFPFKNNILGMGIWYGFYFSIILPIVVLLWNLTNILNVAKKNKITTYIILTLPIIYINFEIINEYPFKSIFLMIISIGVLLTGNYLLNNNQKKTLNF